MKNLTYVSLRGFWLYEVLIATSDPLAVALKALFGAGLVGLTKMSLSSQLMLAAAAADNALLERSWAVAHSERLFSSLFR